MPNKSLAGALWYLREKNWSVIPCKADKKPYVAWEPYQTQRATEEQIRDWWKTYPDANVGIVTGAISDLTVVDLDSAAGATSFFEHLPSNLVCPTVKSPKGQHLYFRYKEGIRNRARFLPDCDVRSEGGYIMAPPSSINGNAYSWIEGRSIKEVEVPILPDNISSIIFNFSLRPPDDTLPTTPNADTLPSTGMSFNEGTRDQSLFHIANCLVKGGMPEHEIQQILGLIGNKICNPPFPEKDIYEKIKSAIKRSDNAARSLAEEVKDWIVSSSGVIKSSDVVTFLGLSSRVDKKNLSKIMNRLCEDGLIEKYGDKNGEWRKIDRTFVEQCWWNDDGETLPVKFPLGVHEFTRIYNGNIILLEGQKSQGKSSFALEFCRLNKGLFPQKILYQNMEMSDGELLERFTSYGDVMTPQEWRESVIFTKQSANWWDIILPDGINVIDYLVEYKEPWMLPNYVKEIHTRLKKGIALVLVQRDPFKPYPTGGRGVRDIPRVIISLIKHVIRLEDVKSFNPTAYGNPSGLCRKYKQISWWNFKPDSMWQQEEEERYVQFKGKEK